MPYDVIELTKDLIKFPTITPRDEGCLEYLGKKLEDIGFECHHMTFGEGPETTRNLFARHGTDGPHLCYGGHTDVVPPGPEDNWKFGPFNPTIENGKLYGRGVSDMKGSIAAFVAGVSHYLETHKPAGSISLLITGDEEGEANYGTVKVLEWMKENNHVPDVAIVGEPTSPKILGQEIKIGRRGSLSGHLTVRGKQGHVAYPHLADNPVPKLVKILDTLGEFEFDQGSEFFPPTNLEITTIDVCNDATNVIPETANAKFNVRFSDHWSGKTLLEKIHEIIKPCGFEYELKTFSNAESFITQPGDWSDTVRQAVKEITGQTAEYTTNGGTSDARFIVNYCPVVEFGGINATIHQIDENATVEDLENLAKVYERILDIYLK